MCDGRIQQRIRNEMRANNGRTFREKMSHELKSKYLEHYSIILSFLIPIGEEFHS